VYLIKINIASGRIAQVVELRPLDREVRGSNPSHDTMALLLGRHYEFPQCGIIKEKLLLLLLLFVFIFSYVSRQHYKDTAKHVILGTQQFKPTEFAAQINLNMDNAWGILRCIVDTCMKLKEGKYLIMKDPNKVCLCRVF
jgi:hypothetical protein